MVEKKGEERILVRECKARLGERETLTSPGVRVLSLDGGGMRGVVTLLMLEELEKMTGVKTHQMFDLIVGTSTGAVIASMMGISCMGAREGLELYMEIGRKIFKGKMLYLSSITIHFPSPCSIHYFFLADLHSVFCGTHHCHSTGHGRGRVLRLLSIEKR